MADFVPGEASPGAALGMTAEVRVLATGAPLPQTSAALRRGVENGLHTGAMVAVGRPDGSVLATVGAGTTLDGVAMEPRQQLPPWFCAAKPLLLIALARLVSSNELAWDDPVARYIEPFGVRGKEQVTLRHVLTHAIGFRDDPVELLGLGWDTAVRAVCRTPPAPGMVPGRDHSYLPFTCWYLMGEVLRRATGKPLRDLVEAAVVKPLGLTGTSVAMTGSEYRQRRAQLTPVGTHQVRGDPARHEFRLPVESEEVCGGAGPMATRGPLADLVRLYTALAFRTEPPDGVSDVVWRELTARPECPVFDHRHRVETALGMGLVFEGRRFGEASRVFGPRCGPDTLGHRGLGSLVAFADRDARVAAAVFFDTTNQGLQNRVRIDEVTSSVYEDLRL